VVQQDAGVDDECPGRVADARVVVLGVQRQRVLVDTVQPPGRRPGLDERVGGDLLVLRHVVDPRLAGDPRRSVRADLEREPLQRGGVGEGEGPAVLGGQFGGGPLGRLRCRVVLEHDDVVVGNGARLVGVADLTRADGGGRAAGLLRGRRSGTGQATDDGGQHRREGQPTGEASKHRNLQMLRVCWGGGAPQLSAHRHLAVARLPAGCGGGPLSFYPQLKGVVSRSRPPQDDRIQEPHPTTGGMMRLFTRVAAVVLPLVALTVTAAGPAAAATDGSAATWTTTVRAENGTVYPATAYRRPGGVTETVVDAAVLRDARALAASDDPCGYSCDGKDPASYPVLSRTGHYYYCSADAFSPRTLTDGAGHTVEVRYSPSCRTAWARGCCYTNYRGNGYYASGGLRSWVGATGRNTGSRIYTAMLNDAGLLFSACYDNQVGGSPEWKCTSRY
jgi:hypothetical protein